MGFRLYVTTNTRKYVDAGLSTADVYGTLVLGEEAYGTVKLDTMPARVIQKQPGTSGIYDPLDQAASIGGHFSADLKLRVINGNTYGGNATATRCKQAA